MNSSKCPSKIVSGTATNFSLNLLGQATYWARKHALTELRLLHQSWAIDVRAVGDAAVVAQTKYAGIPHRRRNPFPRTVSQN